MEEEVSLKIYKFLEDLGPSNNHKYVILEGLEEYIFGKKGKQPKDSTDYIYMGQDEIEFLLLGSEAPCYDELKS